MSSACDLCDTVSTSSAGGFEYRQRLSNSTLVHTISRAEDHPARLVSGPESYQSKCRTTTAHGIFFGRARKEVLHDITFRPEKNQAAIAKTTPSIDARPAHQRQSINACNSVPAFRSRLSWRSIGASSERTEIPLRPTQPSASPCPDLAEHKTCCCLDSVKDLRILPQPLSSRRLRRVQRASPMVTCPHGASKIK